MIAEHGVVFDTDLLFLLDVFQPLSACRVHSVVNERDQKLQNAIAVLQTCILYSGCTSHCLFRGTHLSLCTIYIIYMYIIHSIYISTHLARAQMLFLPQLDLQLLVEQYRPHEYDDLRLIFCEALLG